MAAYNFVEEGITQFQSVAITVEQLNIRNNKAISANQRYAVMADLNALIADTNQPATSDQQWHVDSNPVVNISRQRVSRQAHLVDRLARTALSVLSLCR